MFLKSWEQHVKGIIITLVREQAAEHLELDGNKDNDAYGGSTIYTHIR